MRGSHHDYNTFDPLFLGNCVLSLGSLFLLAAIVLGGDATKRGKEAAGGKTAKRDAKELLVFDILWHTPKSYRTTPKKDGWIKSNVFGKTFRLTQQANEFGDPEYMLEVR